MACFNPASWIFTSKLCETWWVFILNPTIFPLQWDSRVKLGTAHPAEKSGSTRQLNEYSQGLLSMVWVLPYHFYYIACICWWSIKTMWLKLHTFIFSQISNVPLPLSCLIIMGCLVLLLFWFSIIILQELIMLRSFSRSMNTDKLVDCRNLVKLQLNSKVYVVDIYMMLSSNLLQYKKKYFWLQKESLINCNQWEKIP